MKRILLIALLLCAMFTTTAYFISMAAPSALFGKGQRVKGSGNIITRTIDAPDFERIDAARAIKVVISDELKDKIRIEADDNIMEHVLVKAKGGELTISIHNDIKSINNMNVTVTVPDNGRIRSIDASSASSVTSDVVLEAEKFSLVASSAANIKVAVKATSCNIETSSASKIEADLTVKNCSVESSSASNVVLKGSADSCNADLSSAAELSADKFVVTYYTIDTSSASGAYVNCTGKLTADASSGSKIRYTGDCDTSIDKSSGGSVKRN